jgi:hypothetical protein
VGISITFLKNRFPSGVGLSSGDKKCWMHNFTLASPLIPNIKFLSFVVSEKCIILFGERWAYVTLSSLTRQRS